MIVATTPMKLTPSAVPSDVVAPWIWDPTQSQSSGVPIHNTRLPMNMISNTRAAPMPVRSRLRMCQRRVRGPQQRCGRWLTDSRMRA